jgi:hypothetical protein
VESQTHVEVTNTADFTGQGASLGKAVIQEASDHLVQRLIDCVSGRFATGLGDLPSAEELATATAAEHAPARQQAVGERMSLPADPQEAVQPEPEPAANAVPGRERPTNADTDRQPTTNADIDRQVTANADTTRSALDAQKASAPHTDYASAASGVADGSAASAPHPPALPVPAGPEGNSLATMVLPRVRRLGPPVLGALAAVSVISSIVRRIRR